MEKKEHIPEWHIYLKYVLYIYILTYTTVKYKIHVH